MTIKIYQKNPIVIEAVQYDGTNQEEITKFTETRAFLFGKDNAMEIPTSEGNHKCSVGDYVIKGISNEFYPCKPDIFKKTYTEIKKIKEIKKEIKNDN